MSLPRAARRSATEIGLAYENHCLSYLNNGLHMSLRRVGRAGDGGVDLRGKWYIPIASDGSRKGHGGIEESIGGNDAPAAAGPSRAITVIGQCKAEKKPLGPRVVRELEGVMAGLQHRQRQARSLSASPFPLSSSSSSSSSSPSSLALQPDSSVPSPTESPTNTSHLNDTNSDTIAILLSQSGFSSSSMTHASRSGIPFMLIHLLGGHPHDAPHTEEENDDDNCVPIEPETSDFDGLVQGMYLNPALISARGVLGGKVQMKREILDGSGVDNLTGDVRTIVRFGLWFEGQRLRRMGPR